MLKRVFKLAIACFVAMCVLAAAGFAWLRASVLPEHVIAREIADYRGLDISLRHVTAPPPSRAAVWHATLDHVVSPVRELSDKRVTLYQGVYRDSAGNSYLLFTPSGRTDSYVVYRCEADGRLLWKAYVEDSP